MNHNEDLFLEYTFAENALDKELIILNAVIESKVNRHFFELESLIMEHEARCRDIELSLLTESSTFDDAYKLYLEEEEKTEKESKGIIGSLLEALGKLIDKVKKLLFGNKKPKEEDFPKQAKIIDPSKMMEAGNKAINALDAALKGDIGPLKSAKEHPFITAGLIMLGRKELFSEYTKYEQYVNTVEQKKTAWQNYQNSALANDENLKLFRPVFNFVMETITKLEVLGKLPDKSYQNFKNDPNAATPEGKQKKEESNNLSNEEIEKRKKRIDEINTEIKKIDEEIKAAEKLYNSGGEEVPKSILDKLNLFKSLKTKLDAHDLKKYKSWLDAGKPKGSFSKYDENNYDKLQTKYGSKLFSILDNIDHLKSKKKRLEEEREECYTKIRGHHGSIESREENEFKAGAEDRFKDGKKDENNDENGKKDENNDESK